MVSNIERPINHPIYSLDSKMGSTIFFNEGKKEKFSLQNASFMPTQRQLEGLWNMSFEEVACKEGAGAGVWVQLPKEGALNYSYKFSFECTNNEAEYKALMLVIQILKKICVKKVVIQGDFDLVIKQLQGDYQARHPRMRTYMNAMLDMVEGFEECEFSLIP